MSSASGSLPCVALITGWFGSEHPLHDGAKMAISTIFEQSWPDPAGGSIDARSAAILLQETRETFAAHLGARADEIHFLGEPTLGFHLGISGLLSPETRLVHSAIDKKEIFAVANSIADCVMAPVSENGVIAFPEISNQDLLVLQLMNGETGVINTAPELNGAQLFVDATTSGVRIPLPEKWSTALWDSRSWYGPAGLGVFAVRTGSLWRNPLPHNDNRVVPEGAALSLIVASALAIDSWVADQKNVALKISEINARIRGFIAENIAEVDFASESQFGSPHLLSFSFLYVEAEELVRRMRGRGFEINSGSACISANMEPSHVLAAMGRLTHGNVRLTIHHEITPEEVDELLLALVDCVAELRGN